MRTDGKRNERQRGVSGCRDFCELRETDEAIGLSFRKKGSRRGSCSLSYDTVSCFV